MTNRFPVHIPSSKPCLPDKYQSSKADLVNHIVVDDSQPFVVIDIEGKVLKNNEKYSLLYDLADGLSFNIDPDNKALQADTTILAAIEDVLVAKSTVRTEEHICIDGQEYIFTVRYIPVFLERNMPQAIVVTYEDVTKQVMVMRQANLTEARFKDFARASFDWFFECDRALCFTHLSDRFTTCIEQPSALFIGKCLADVGVFRPNLDNEEIASKAIARRKPFRDQLFVIKNRHQQNKLFHLSAVPIFDRTTGKFVGYRGVGMDVEQRYAQAAETRKAKCSLETLLKELTQKNMALDKANERAQAALSSKNDFLATMSHELRTPLNAIIGFASSFELETFGALNEKYIDYAKDIRTSGEHLLSLINDILDVAKIEAGGMALTLISVEISDIVHQARSLIDEMLTRKSLTCIMKINHKNVKLLIDERRFLQVLMNLLSNSIKFTPAGGVIGIEDAVNHAENTYSLTVWDKGIGIAPEDLDRVFGKFEQVRKHVYNREQEGTGLGLHISRELVRKMSGSIHIESKENEGSRLTITFPLA